jgi:hypothetical protein
MSEIDFGAYSRPPRIDAVGGLALARRLIRACPTSRFPVARRRIGKVREEAVALQAELKARARVRPSGLRALDSAFDGAWAAVRDRIAAWTKVSLGDYDAQRKRAEKLMASYFVDGVAFVQLSYEKEWVESQLLLDRFAEEGALTHVEQLAGKAFVENVNAAHKALGDAIGLTGAGPAAAAPSSTGVAERVEALARAIFDYLRGLTGDVEDNEAASVTAFRRAVEPLDTYRAEASSDTPAKPDADAEPTAPIPPVPAPVEPGLPGGPALDPAS